MLFEFVGLKRVVANMVSRKWIKCRFIVRAQQDGDLVLVSEPVEALDAKDEPTQFVVLRDEMLKLSNVFQQKSASLFDVTKGSKVNYFVRLVRLKGLGMDGAPMVYQGRIQAVNGRQVPLIGPSASQDLERTETVMKIGATELSDLERFARFLDSQLIGLPSQAWEEEGRRRYSVNDDNVVDIGRRYRDSFVNVGSKESLEGNSKDSLVDSPARANGKLPPTAPPRKDMSSSNPFDELDSIVNSKPAGADVDPFRLG